MDKNFWNTLADSISEALGETYTVREQRSVGGGCINSAYRVSDGRRSLFVKLNEASSLDMFEAEQAGLLALAQTESIRVPRPLTSGVAANQAYLVMEDLDLSGRADPVRLGHQLAAMHGAGGDHFGWQRDNTIGATPQPNPRSFDWVEFYGRHRLGFQLDLAARHGHGGVLQRKGEQVAEHFAALFSGYAPVPSLLHGDLWGGNVGGAADGTPAIFDPAVYYGDREADIAMTELFGGFGRDFYAAYDEAWPRDSGYTVRRTLYNLYHILNHLNLFGAGYAGQAESMMDRLLAELR